MSQLRQPRLEKRAANSTLVPRPIHHSPSEASDAPRRPDVRTAAANDDAIGGTQHKIVNPFRVKKAANSGRSEVAK